MNKKTIENITRDVLNNWNHNENCVILVSSTTIFGGTVEEGAETYPEWNINVSCESGSHYFNVETPKDQSEQKTKELIKQSLRKHLEGI